MIAEEEFREFINKKLIERERQVIKSKQLAIKAIPEIGEIFKRSNHYSSKSTELK